MKTNMRWVFLAAIAILMFVAIFLVRPQPALHSPETILTNVSKVVAPEPQTPLASPPQSAQVPSAPFARYSTSEDLGFNALGQDAAIFGRVTDLHGKPVAYAHIVSTDSMSMDSTDAAGNYRLLLSGDGPRELIAMHEGYSDSARLTAAPGDRDVDFMLPPLGAIEGRVVSARDGRAVTEFRIRPQPVPGSALPEEGEYKKLRDDAGQFRLDRIKAGTNAIAVGAKGFADAVIAIPPVRAGETRDRVEVRLEAGAELHGRVVNEAGLGVRFARISGGTPRRGAISDADGAFRLDSLPAGPFEITVKHGDFASKIVTVGLGGGMVNRILVVLDEGIVLTGEFTLGGKPVEGDVVVTPGAVEPPKVINGVPTSAEPEFRMTAHAGPDGKYLIRGVPEGEVRVEGSIEWPQAYQTTWRKEARITVTSSTAPVLDFDFPPVAGIVEGVVFAAPNTPLVGDTLLHISYSDFTAEGPAQLVVTSHTAGGYYLLNLPSGSAGIALMVTSRQSYDGPRNAGFTVDLKEGDRVRHDFLLYKGTKLRISVAGNVVPMNSHAIVLRGEQVVTDLNEDFFKSAPIAGGESLDPSGHVTVFGLEPGTYTVLIVSHSPPSPRPKVMKSTVITVGKDEDVSVPIELAEH